MLLVVLSVIVFTVPTWTQLDDFNREIENIRANPSSYEGVPLDASNLPDRWFFESGDSVGMLYNGLMSLIPMGMVIFLYVVFGLLMASVLIGGERNSQMSDFSMSLPFTRTQLYISKWLIGASGFIVATLLGGPLLMAIIHLSDFSFLIQPKDLEVSIMILFMMLTGISVFSISLWMGSFGGESISQALWSFVALLFPIGIISLIEGSLYTFERFIDVSYSLTQVWMESIPLRVISPLANIFNIDTYDIFRSNGLWEDFVTVAPLSALASIVISFGLGLWTFNRAPQENNGRFFMFSNWLWLVHLVMVLCFGMLGGIMLSAITFSANIVLYIVGFAIGGFIAHLLAKRLLYRFNLKLKS
nr:ABC transporter permease subunit [Exiguobacterium sp. s70]